MLRKDDHFPIVGFVWRTILFSVRFLLTHPVNVNDILQQHMIVADLRQGDQQAAQRVRRHQEADREHAQRARLQVAGGQEEEALKAGGRVPDVRVLQAQVLPQRLRPARELLPRGVYQAADVPHQGPCGPCQADG